MPDQPQDRHPHLVLTNTSAAQAFKARLTGWPAPFQKIPGKAMSSRDAITEDFMSRILAAAQQVAAQTAVPITVTT